MKDNKFCDSIKTVKSFSVNIMRIIELKSQKGESVDSMLKDAEVMIINCFGKLSSIYRYARIALVGGGFGVGIHNVPEAAVYGIPVIIGPNNQRFQEAQELLQIGMDLI